MRIVKVSAADLCNMVFNEGLEEKRIFTAKIGNGKTQVISHYYNKEGKLAAIYHDVGPTGYGDNFKLVPPTFEG